MLGLNPITNGMTGSQAAATILDNDNFLNGRISQTAQEIDDEITELRGEIPDVTGLSGQVSALSQTVTNNKTATDNRLTSVESDLQGTQQDVSNLGDMLSETNQTVTNNKNAVDQSIVDILHGLQTESERITNNKNAADQSISTLTTGLQDVSTRVTNNKNAADQSLSNLNTKVDNNKNAADSSISGLNTKIDNTKTTTDGVIADLTDTVLSNHEYAVNSLGNVNSEIASINLRIPSGDALEYTRKLAGKTIVLYGDSIMSSDYVFLSEALHNKLGATVVPAGRPGYMAEQLASEAALTELFSRQADAIVMMFGTNDIGQADTVGTFNPGLNPIEQLLVLSPVDVDTPYSGIAFIQAVDYIIRRAYKEAYNKGLRLYVCDGLPQKRNNESDAFSQIDNGIRKALAVREVCTRLNVPCIHTFDNYGVYMPNEPFWTYPTDPAHNNGLYTMDGVHPNPYGAESLASIISNKLRIASFPVPRPPEPNIIADTLFMQHGYSGGAVALHEVVRDYPASSKSYAFTVPDDATSTSGFLMGQNNGYAYSQWVGGNEIKATSTDATIQWLAGSTSRYVIVLGSDFAMFPDGAEDCLTRVHQFRVGGPTGNTSVKRVAVDRAIGLTVIPESAFAGCTGMDIAALPGIVEIGTGAFAGCTNLGGVSLPTTLTRIGDSAFEGCTGLVGIGIPASVTIIGYLAFKGCTGLVTLGSDIHAASIGQSAFEGCTSLEYPSLENTTMTVLSQSVFSGCTAMVGVTLPQTLTEIRETALYGCTGLSELDIPASVVSMGPAALYGCSNLFQLRCRAVNPPALTGAQVFFEVPTTILHVPTGCKAVYDAAAQWTDFEPIIGDL